MDLALLPDPAPPAPVQVTVIGAGLAGCLTALQLAERGVAVRLIAPTLRDSAPFPVPTGAAAGPGRDPLPPPAPAGAWMATALSYGSVAGRAAAARWRDLERRHGSLGWRPSAVVLHGCIPSGEQATAIPAEAEAGAVRSLPGWIRRLRAPLLPAPLPFSRLEGPALARALPAALQRVGVEMVAQSVLGLEPAADGWQLQLADGRRFHSPTLLLAAGAGSVALWPALKERLRCSWAGVLLLPELQGRSRWLAAVRRGWMVFPARLQRPALERLAPTAEARWGLDLGLVPWGEGALLGQITWLPPAAPDPAVLPGWESAALCNATDQPPVRQDKGTATRSPGCGQAFRAGAPSPPPDPAQLERWLRQGLTRLDPTLADLEARFHLAPVSYCPDGVPLAEALAPGLWVLAGCSNAYSHLPALAEGLADAILAAEVKAA
ncbi:MAG: FAD-dependent oxidoreductase [Cyanobium sp.]